MVIGQRQVICRTMDIELHQESSLALFHAVSFLSVSVPFDYSYRNVIVLIQHPLEI